MIINAISSSAKVWRSVDKNSSNRIRGSLTTLESEFDLSRDAEVPMITGNTKHSHGITTVQTYILSDLTRSIGSFEDLEEEELEHLVQNEVIFALFLSF
jgi:hypothetical protein